MDRPHILALYLEDIFILARAAVEKPTKKALHEKVKTVTKELDKISDTRRLAMGSNIERVRLAIDTILGYSDGNGHSVDQHISWAIGELEVLKENILE